MYKSEWLSAINHYELRLRGAKQSDYIIPVFIDDTRYDDPDLPDIIRMNQGYNLNDEKLIDMIIAGLKDYQSKNL